MAIRTFFQPSLGRRLVLALLAAFALVAVVLTAQDYWRIRGEFEEGAASVLTRQLGDVGRTLDRFEQSRDVDAILSAMAWHANDVRHQQHLDGELIVQLQDDAGHANWATPGAPHVAQPAHGRGQQVWHFAGRRYRVGKVATRHGHLIMAEPYPGDRRILDSLLEELMPSLLIAFPLVLLPTWLAVRQGLKPLRRLSLHMRRREAHDLAPLQLDLQYAELQPVIEAFNSLLGKLRQQVQRERAFVQDAAHELRTPMAVIAAQAHVLSVAADEAQRHQARDALEGAIERASHLAQQLLALASLDGAQARQPQPVNLPHLLQRLLAQAMPLAQRRHIDIELEAPDELHTGLDVIALQSVFGNLIDNAIKYGREGGRIFVDLTRDGDTLKLSVLDDGPGIAAGQRPFIFERFVRGAQDDTQGTGLGLAIVRQGARCLQGQVLVGDGLDGRGVGFILSWPVCRV